MAKSANENGIVEFFEGWKELILHPDKEIPKRKKFDNGRTVLFIALMALISATIEIYTGLNGNVLAPLSTPVRFMVDFAFAFFGMPLMFFFIHLAARLFGGKGKYTELLSIYAEAYVVFSIVGLVVLIPFVGTLLLSVTYLASLAAIWTTYKFLRLRYALSRGRTIAAFIIGGMVWGALFMIGYSIFAFLILSSGAPSSITSTANGGHFYSPLHGGYSFDFPSGWEASSTRIHNDFSSADRLVNKKEKRMIDILITKNMNTTESGSCNAQEIQSIFGGEVDISKASAEKISWGHSQGCLANIIDLDGKEVIAYGSTNCSGKTDYVFKIFAFPEDYAVLRSVVESLRCGSDALG